MFTKRPWKIIYEDIGDEEICIVPIEIIGADGFRVVSREGGLAPDCEWHSDTLVANARLIAAAPDLYEALKYARRFLKPREHDTEYVDNVLAKAWGGSE
jgi:hypothetical protein